MPEFCWVFSNILKIGNLTSVSLFIWAQELLRTPHDPEPGLEEGLGRGPMVRGQPSTTLAEAPVEEKIKKSSIIEFSSEARVRKAEQLRRRATFI